MRNNDWLHELIVLSRIRSHESNTDAIDSTLLELRCSMQMRKGHESIGSDSYNTRLGIQFGKCQQIIPFKCRFSFSTKDK